MYVSQTMGLSIDLNDKILFRTLEEHTHIVAQFFKKVMGPVFGVDSYWYRQEFAKSKRHGSPAWSLLEVREARELLNSAVSSGLSDEQCAE